MRFSHAHQQEATSRNSDWESALLPKNESIKAVLNI